MAFRDHWAGHLLLFGGREPPSHSSAAGLKLLLIVLLLEGLIGPRLGLLDLLGVARPPSGCACRRCWRSG